MPSILPCIAALSLLVVASLAPGSARGAGEQTVSISATDQMKFDTTDITGKIGAKITITLTNDGSLPKGVMAHNIVILKPGTDVAAFISAASDGTRAGAGYLPDDSQAGNMIVHTKLLGPGEEDTITFTPTAAGVYEYVCTFPGHTAAGMRGKIPRGVTLIWGTDPARDHRARRYHRPPPSGQADEYIHAIFAGLKEKGYLQNSIVVITGDHGESLGERGRFGHSHNLYAEEVQPPLMIYDPDSVEYQNLAFARQVDVAPTILDRLGLPIPSTWDGHSLLQPEMPRFSYLRMADTYAVLDHTSDRTLKYIYDDRTKKEELYDDTQDPTEQHDILATTGAQELGDLRKAVGAFSVHPGT